MPASPDVEGTNNDADEARPDVEGTNHDADEARPSKACPDVECKPNVSKGLVHDDGVVQDMY